MRIEESKSPPNSRKRTWQRAAFIIVAILLGVASYGLFIRLARQPLDVGAAVAAPQWADSAVGLGFTGPVGS